MKLLKFNRNALAQLFLLLVGFQVFFSVLNMLGDRSQEYKASYMTGVGSLYLLLFPLIMMTSFASISVHISLTMGGLRRALGWQLAALNVICCAVVCASQWGSMWVLSRMFGSDSPVFLAGFPRLAMLASAGTLVLGGLGLWMGLCAQRWGGKALALCALAELVVAGGVITWFVISFLKGGAAGDILAWLLAPRASAASLAAVAAGCAAVAALLHLASNCLLKKAVVRV
ncbi:hypothetical protein WMO24_08150 [Ruthenibacterium sp. CLA-JM-H11]|uniref:Uncharacterized protein n=1 Tax=Ruthenibacterium intestinale TaxID=3133163 RepID=A0ABV1GEX4_9FIRM